MCGRFEINIDLDLEELRRIDQIIKTKYDTPYQTGEIYPTNIVPILMNSKEKTELQLMNWGIPKWDGKGHVINAKSETASEKKLFAQSLIQRRCVIPSTGFYEWKKHENSDRKDKLLFTNPLDSMLYLAGIFNLVKIDGEFKNFFVILTQEANSSISDIHNRMPVILSKNELTEWLKNDTFVNTVFNRNNVCLERKVV